MSLLKQDIIKKERMEKVISRLEFKNNSKGNGNKCEAEVIQDSTVYVKESEIKGHLSGLYFHVLWKKYIVKENA